MDGDYTACAGNSFQYLTIPARKKHNPISNYKLPYSSLSVGFSPVTVHLQNDSRSIFSLFSHQLNQDRGLLLAFSSQGQINPVFALSSLHVMSSSPLIDYLALCQTHPVCTKTDPKDLGFLEEPITRHLWPNREPLNCWVHSCLCKPMQSAFFALEYTDDSHPTCSKQDQVFFCKAGFQPVSPPQMEGFVFGFTEPAKPFLQPVQANVAPQH